MKRDKTLLVLALIVMTLSVSALPGEGKFSGLMIGDYFYTLTHHDEAVEGNNGFWLRRVYFTYDNTLNTKFSLRFRLETNSPGDFKTSSTLVPFIKDAYLAAQLGRHTLMLGLIGTQMYSSVEKFWGYRAIEKTPIDLFKFGNSRDLGLGLQGALDPKGELTYSLVVGNGSGTKAEVNRGKAVHGRINFRPTKNLFLELYADYTATGKDNSISIFQAFAGIQGGWGRTGLNFGYRHADNGDYGTDLKFISLFGVCKLNPKLELAGRFDRQLDPNPSGSRIDYIPMADNAKANVLLAGLGWALNENVKIIPNLKYIVYDASEDGERPDADLYAYLTLYFIF